MNSITEEMNKVGQQARRAAWQLARASSAQKNAALNGLAQRLIECQQPLMDQNEKDLDAGRARGLDESMLDRLALTSARIDAMADGLQQIAALQDPVGAISGLQFRPSGIQVGQMRVPLGVIGMVYESRPNVTADAAGLCIKSGNAVILRGGSESIHSNLAIAKYIAQSLRESGLPEQAVQVIQTVDRAAVSALLRMDQYVDVIIPRGGKGLIQRVVDEATIPVIKHLDGVCHVYIHAEADMSKAIRIAFNAKAQRTGVCNAMETLLVDQHIATKVLPDLAAEFSSGNVELRGCDQTRAILPQIAPACDEDWVTEYLAPVLSIKVVEDVEQAIEHINTYGSHHTDAIVTQNYSVARQFLREVDSSSVMVNASTRFADGYEYGLGAEIGISTNKLHARGPVGLEGLTTMKYVVLGDGEIRT